MPLAPLICTRCGAPLPAHTPGVESLVCSYCHTTFEPPREPPPPSPAERHGREDRTRNRPRVVDPDASAEADEEIAAARRAEAAEARFRTIVICVFAVAALGAVALYKGLGGPALTPAQSLAAACKKGDGKSCDLAGNYDAACKKGYGPGCTHYGRAQEPQYGWAATAYDSACKLGDKPGCDALEALLQTTKLNMGQRVDYYERDCEAGKLPACVLAGTLYATAKGDGLARDEKKETALYAKACDGGLTSGCDLLAGACAKGFTQAGAAANCPHPSPASSASAKRR
ncbi:MAG: hypothetical protein ACLQVI_23790 [Polyangiaceae bacterium]